MTFEHPHSSLQASNHTALRAQGSFLAVRAELRMGREAVSGWSLSWDAIDANTGVTAPSQPDACLALV